ncbi:MAG: TAXI family TRAP transporter solute-binding subunit [bacterium]|jgi:TRAP transporter TAXI family solute receptor
MSKITDLLRGLAAMTAAGAIAASPVQARDIGIAASNPGSLYHSTGTAVAKVANDAAQLKATVHPFASATVYLPAVSAGEYGFGISNIEELRVAVTGAAQFKGRDYSNLRAATILYPLRVAFFVRKDSPIKTVADLKGKRVVDGFSSQKTIPPLLDAEYATAGMSRKDITPVNVPNVVGGANAFIQGKADAFFFALGAAKVREADAAVGGIRALDVADTPENLAKIRKFFPPAYLRPEKPSKRNVGVLAPIHVITYDAALVASTKTADEDVYALVKAMHANKKMMAEVFGVMNLFDPNRMVKDLGPIHWHAGAQKFYQELGVWPPK